MTEVRINIHPPIWWINIDSGDRLKALRYYPYKLYFCSSGLRFAQTCAPHALKRGGVVTRNPNQKQRTPCAVSFVFGGDKRVRTAGLLNAIQALYQLSYTPIFGKLLYCNIYAVNCQTFFAFMPIKIYCFRLSAFKRGSLLQAILRECVLHMRFVGTRFGNYFTSSPLSAFCNMIQ